MLARINHIVLGFFCLIVCILSTLTGINYPGHVLVYLLFTILLNVLLVLGFTKDRIFFDTFIGIFFWLGYWLKFSVRVAFMDGTFYEPVGSFNGTGVAYDHALLVTSYGVAALLMANFIRRRFLFTYEKTRKPTRHESTLAFYEKHRKSVLIVFCGLFVFVAITNLIFGIYQRGMVSGMRLPFGLNGVYTWLLLFGMASISAVLLHCEFTMNANPYLVSTIGFLECFFSSISMFSRAMIINGGALLIGIIANVKGRLSNSKQFKFIFIILVGVLFVLSIFFVNYARRYEFSGGTTFSSVEDSVAVSKILMLDRWVGIEGIMAVSSYPGLGWDLWRKAWHEGSADSGTSMYDTSILDTDYKGIDMSRYRFIKLPGILAFFYYPGSGVFLFISMLCLGFIAMAIELFVYRFGGGNMILCSLLGQVVAYRYAHFGYVPNQSYLLFGSIVLNVLIIFGLECFLSAYSRKRYGHNGAKSSEI